MRKDGSESTQKSCQTEMRFFKSKTKPQTCNDVGPDQLYKSGLIYYSQARSQTGSDLDYRMAVDLMKKAAVSGLAEAQNALGEMYYDGLERLSVQQNYQEVIECFKQAANQNYAKAQYNMGLMHQKGMGVPQDNEQAIEWFQQAADQGCVEAQFELGKRYYDDGVALHNESLKRYAAYDKTRTQLLYQYPNKGFDRTERNKFRGALRKAWARLELEDKYNPCRAGSGRELYKKAIEWFKAGANQGYAPAQHQLGAMYYNDHGVNRDNKKAMELFKQAAEQGYAEAQCSLGYMYANGLDVLQKQNYNHNSWLNNLHSQGNETNQIGVGVHENKKAVEWFQKAANQGNAEALYYLSRCFSDSRGVDQNLSQAILLCKKAVNKNDKREYTQYLSKLESQKQDINGVPPASSCHIM